MKCILLAAGYATRLYPLTENMPKALLKLGDKTILDMVVEKIDEVSEVDDIFIVTNNKFYTHFSDWAKSYSGPKRVKVLNDGTTSNDNRLGAIGDLKFVIDSENIDDEILVMASDNIFGFPLTDFTGEYAKRHTDMICAHRIENKAELHTMGVVELDKDGRVLSFEEKPERPKSDLGVPPFYLYRRETLALIDKYLAEGNNPDAPGHFIPWLITQTDVYAHVFDATRIDIGTVESYNEACELQRQGTLFEKRI
ncbi:MAG TPA: nucleotidyltransferase family protein [Candidatus Ornithomonoglobus intestinigallinarum]|uniref:Nucleotidyltransferase family protein n=1 Tax=Candidatus Ornithomonoglobus intestinigallinarum TaxID=2840894 RepID=A0A9D1KQV4_9FIRM|nr:nucleotidyltransferase family protein [Candidatus Ornithomonoglobus intestinigallinarum]